MIGTPPLTFGQVRRDRGNLRPVDRYARWEYGMADATPLLDVLRRARGARRPKPLDARAPPSRHVSGRLHPLRLIALLIAPRHR